MINEYITVEMETMIVNENDTMCPDYYNEEYIGPLETHKILG